MIRLLTRQLRKYSLRRIMRVL